MEITEARGRPPMYEWSGSFHPPKKSVMVAQWICDQILSGRFLPGQKIPSEREICKELQVSRYPVREAIGALVAQRILRVHPGDGTYVLRTLEPGENDDVMNLVDDVQSPLEALELRRIIEVGMIRLIEPAALTELDAELREAIQAMKQAVQDGDKIAHIEADDRFHFALARATGNSAILYHLTLLVKTRRKPLWLAIREAVFTSDHYEKMLEIHDRIRHHLVRGEMHEAELAMLAHFDEVSQWLRRLDDGSLTL